MTVSKCTASFINGERITCLNCLKFGVCTGYAVDIQRRVVEEYAKDRLGLRGSLAQVAAQQPPPLADKATRKRKCVAVAEHVKRMK